MKRSIWEIVAHNDLTYYLSYKQSLQHLENQLSALQEDGSDLNPNAQANQLVMRDKLKNRFEYTKKKVTSIEQSLQMLSDQQRMILEKAYIRPVSRPIEKIMEACCVEQTRAYQLKKEALYRFTLNMYGCDPD